MKKVYILSACRTPIGSFGGIFAGLSAIDLGITASKAAVTKSGIESSTINEVFYGNVCSANLGQAPARQITIGSGLGNHIPSTTINKVCSSGLKSVMIAAQSIMLGDNEVVLAGGTESMSNIPHYLPSMRWGTKYGASPVIDGLQKDGLTDVYDQIAMGNFADETAVEEGISRAEQDRYAIQSYRRAQEATNSGRFLKEICLVSVPQRKGDALMIDKDEECFNVMFDKIPGLRPAFSKEGTVTAANASTINDGAASIILASEDFVKAHGLTPLAEIVGFSDAAHAPQRFTTAPLIAAPKVLAKVGMKMSDMDYFEVNEAFAVVSLTFIKSLGLSEERVNINGGAVSLGHPLGASGARILTTLIHTLEDKNANLGLAAICNGGGGASAMIIKRM
ncbi:MAG: thiolase family protein [Saprospiraceae bacterium]